MVSVFNFTKELAMISSTKLRKIRHLRNMTQKEVASLSGLTPAAIRNYELGNRSPSKKQLDKIALALNCNPSAITDYSNFTIYDIIQLILDLEPDFGFSPCTQSEIPKLKSSNESFNNFLKDWDEMRLKKYNYEISEEKLFKWIISYNPGNHKDEI